MQNKSLLWHFALHSRPLSAARSIMVATNRLPHALLCIAVTWMGPDEQLLPVGWHSKPPVLSSTTPPRASCHIRKIAGCACAGNAGNVFPATDFKGNRELAIPACITARALRMECMSGSLSRGDGENVPGIPGACTTRNLTYLARDPYNSFWRWVMWSYQWSPSPMLEEVPDGEYVGQGIVWTAFDVGKSCVRQIEQGTALYHNLVEPCSTPLPIQDGTSLRSSGTQCNRLRWLHIVCGDNRALWRPGVSVTVLLDALHWSHRRWRPIRQSSDGEVPEITHHVDGSRWSQSLVGDVSTTDLLCVAHWNTMSSLHVITDVQMRGLTKPRKWKRPILGQLLKSNPCLTVPIWSRA